MPHGGNNQNRTKTILMAMIAGTAVFVIAVLIAVFFLMRGAEPDDAADRGDPVTEEASAEKTSKRKKQEDEGTVAKKCPDGAIAASTLNAEEEFRLPDKETVLWLDKDVTLERILYGVAGDNKSLTIIDNGDGHTLTCRKGIKLSGGFTMESGNLVTEGYGTEAAICIESGDYVQNGGNVYAASPNAAAIELTSFSAKNVTINGGYLEAVGGRDNGIDRFLEENTNGENGRLDADGMELFAFAAIENTWGNVQLQGGGVSLSSNRTDEDLSIAFYGIRARQIERKGGTLNGMDVASDDALETYGVQQAVMRQTAGVTKKQMERVLSDRENNSNWYFQQLTEQEKEAYATAYLLAEAYSIIPEYVVPKLDVESCKRVGVALAFSGTKLIGLSPALCGGYENADGDACIQLVRQISIAEEKRLAAQCEAAADEILSYLPAGADEYETVKYVYEYVMYNITYKKDGTRTVDGLLLEQATQCDGIARGVQYLLTRAGVDCIFAAASYTGEVKPGTDPASYAGHAWNLVNIDGDWYELDATWSVPEFSDPNNGESNTLPTYRRLNLTTEDMHLGNHRYDLYNKKNTVATATRFDYPVCTATAANYYVREGLLFDSFDVAVLQAAINSEVAARGHASIRFTNDALYEQASAAIRNGSLSTNVRCVFISDAALRTIDLIPE